MLFLREFILQVLLSRQIVAKESEGKMQIALNLLLNTSLLLSICIIFNLYYQKIQHQKVHLKVLGGAILGLAGIVLMSISIKLPNSVIFDTRSILICVAGLFYGVIPTSVATLIIIAYRLFLGGPGVYMGIAVTITSAALGIIWRLIRKNRKKISNFEYYCFGFVNHVIMLLCMFLLPKEIITETLNSIIFPVLVIYPLGTLAMCMIITYEGKSLQTERQLTESEIRFQAVCERAPVGITVETTEQILYANSEIASILGMTASEIENASWQSYTHPEDLDKDLEPFERLISGEIDKYDLLKRYIRKDGEIVWVHLFVAILHRDAIAKSSEYICIIQDITKEVEREHSLIESERRQREASSFLATLLDSIPDHIFYKSKHGVYLGCNKAFEKASGISKDRLIGKNDFEVYDKRTAQSFIDADRVVMNGAEQVRTEETVTYPNGDKIVTETLKTRFYDAEGEVAGLIGISRDVTDRKKKEERIEYLSVHDVMTGLYSRMYFDTELYRLDAIQELPYSVIMGDINALKLTNDLFGHSEGDKLIIQTAELLRSCCEKGIVARIGGDEFSVLLPRVNEEELKKIINKIYVKLEEQRSGDKEGCVFLSISLGYATKNHVEQPLAEVLKTAEEHMYRRKLLEHQSIRSTLLSTIKELLFSKSNETVEHAERMAGLARRLGSRVGLNEADMDALELMATLHDIGKIGISNHILSKASSLDDLEWTEIRKHPEIGYRIALTIPELQGIAGYILCHHERWDGKGYPQGLFGQEIPYISRLISVIDAYDAMTEDRSYRKARTKEEASKEILLHAGTQFDPDIAKVFVENVLIYEIG